MTTNEQLLELAGRCERAKGPDDGLDRDVALACGWEWLGPWSPDNRSAYQWKAPDRSLHIGPPFFTASLDAAIRLVPEGRSREITENVTSGESEVFIWNMRGLGEGDRGVAATTALALCAAALRARSLT
jgi:hypothetical protein